MRLGADGTTIRRHNNPNFILWSQDPSKAPFSEETLPKEQALLEALAFGIRDMGRGIDPLNLSRRHQTNLPKTFETKVTELKEDGFLNEKTNKLFLTSLGARFCDHVSRSFLNL